MEPLFKAQVGSVLVLGTKSGFAGWVMVKDSVAEQPPWVSVRLYVPGESPDRSKVVAPSDQVKVGDPPVMVISIAPFAALLHKICETEEVYENGMLCVRVKEAVPEHIFELDTVIR